MIGAAGNGQSSSLIMVAACCWAMGDAMAMWKQMLVWGMLLAGLVVGMGCQEHLETGYTPQKIGVKDEIHKAMRQPFRSAREAAMAKEKEQDELHHPAFHF